MAKYIPSYVDASGLSQGISRGLEIAAANREKQDQLAEARVNEFMKTYRPDKLRDNDIPDFTNDFNSYKEAALLYSRFNRGGAKPEQLAAAKVNMDKALGNLNSTYSNSATASNKLAEYANYINTAKQKGYQIPDEVTTNYNALATTGIKNIDVAKIPSAFTFDLVPREIDYEGINKLLDSTDAKLKDITTTRQTVPYGTDVNGKTIYTYAETKYAGRDPEATVDMIRKIGNSKGDIANAAKKSYEDFLKGINQNNPSSIAQLDEIRKAFPYVASVKDISPEMVFALPMYMARSQGTVINKDYGEQQYRTTKDIKTLSIAQQKANRTGGGGANPNQGIIDAYSKIKALAESGNTKNDLKTLDLKTQKILVDDVVGAFPGFDVTASDLYVKNDNGVVNVYAKYPIKSKNVLNEILVEPDQLIGPLDEIGTNITATKPLGTKGVNAVPSTAKQVKTGESFIVGDKVMTKSELLKLGYTEAQIKQAVKIGTIKTQ